jgi:hypothetical protein
VFFFPSFFLLYLVSNIIFFPAYTEMPANMEMANLFNSKQEQENFIEINRRLLYGTIMAHDILYLPTKLVCRFIDDEGYMDTSLWT